ncbi:F-box protein At1g67340 [Prosopis cineraria]|uniref:F-box protein At1g67340 n=1 Tax=Prosopis cineraria TaxID=364024 RepID=UPI0024109474|nr:F-box protein At1g67340 [Prosopis cineraria]
MRRPLRHSSKHSDKHGFFDGLPDDLVLFILSKLSSTAPSPSHFITVLLTCKRLNQLALNRLVLSRAGEKIFAVKAKSWSEYAHRFLRRCVSAGNVHASYTLGMIQFYCLENRESGFKLIAQAASRSHAPALYSLAVIQFNGSGGSKSDKDLKAGVNLCAQASLLGHIDALRELGHCLQDGYGTTQNIAEGRRLLIQANARELARVLRSVSIKSFPSRLRSSLMMWRVHRRLGNDACRIEWICPLLSDYGYSVAVPEVHPANRFLRDWYETGRGVLGEELRLCAHIGCGRPETRPHEFRRCSVCGKVNYCSRGCQALDWKLRHKTECSPVEGWVVVNVDVGGGGADIGGNVNGGDDVVNDVVAQNVAAG